MLKCGHLRSNFLSFGFCPGCLALCSNISSAFRGPLLVYFGALPFAPTTSITFHDPQLHPTISRRFSRSWLGRQLFLSHTAPVVSVACSTDDAHIVTGTSGQIRVWDAVSGAVVVPPLDTEVTSVAFSPDGTRFISGSSDSNIYGILCLALK